MNKYKLIAIALLACIASTSMGQKLRLVPQIGHSFQVLSVAFSPDGKTIASGSEDETIKLWNVASGKLLKTLTGHSKMVSSVAFSPDGKTIVSGGGKGIIKLWDVASGTELKTLKGHSYYVHSVAFSPDCKTIASGSDDNTIKLWDAASGTELKTLNGHPNSVYSVAFSPDGKTIVSGGGKGIIKLWDAASGKELKTLKGHSSGVNSVAFSPDGKTIASGSVDCTVKLWNVASGKTLKTLKGHPNSVYSVAFSPDGKTIVSGGGKGTIKLWDAASGKELKTIEGRAVGSVAFSPDGKTIARGSSDTTITLCDVGSGTELMTLAGHAKFVDSVAFSPDGKTLTSGSFDTTIRLWDVASGKELKTLTGHLTYVSSVVFSPDGKTIASGGGFGEIKLWDVRTGREFKTLEGHRGGVAAVAFSPDGQTIASGDHNKTIKLWDITTGRELRTIETNSDYVNSVSFSPDGKTIASGSDDDTIKLWEVASGKEIKTLEGHSNGVKSVAFSPDGKTIASGSSDYTIKVWDAASGKELKTLAGHSSFVKSVAFSPDGKTIASGSYDNTIKLWDIEIGKELKTFTGHSGWVSSLAFSPDGKTIASGSWDTTGKLWDVASGRELCSIVSFEDGKWAVTDSEGRFDVTSLEDEVWLHWVAQDAPFTPLPVTVFMRDYYEPGLLSKVWKREKLKPVKNVLDLSRARPGVSIDSVKSGGSKATVTVSVTKAQLELEGGKVQAGVPQDFRLSRDGKLIASIDGPLKLDATGKWSQTFTVNIPQNGETDLEFKAYCFNQDRVKSDDARQSLKVQLPKKQGKVYIISAGVDHYERTGMDLMFAGNDAMTMSAQLAEALKGKYAEIVSVPLLDVKKEVFKAVLDKLSGKQISTEIPGGEKLARTTTEDLVILSWSGHGLSRSGGAFYLLPSNVKNIANTQEQAFLDSCISTDELTEWLQDVECADMAFIVDACHSAAAVQSEAFKPAPLGNRGLGQLAYDKGIRILAATQAENVALESGALGNGLLTYALLHDGIQEKKAVGSLKEWLTYAVERVPQIYQELKNGTLKMAKGARSSNAGASGNEQTIQRPALFDFTRKPSPVPFVNP